MNSLLRLLTPSVVSCAAFALPWSHLRPNTKGVGRLILPILNARADRFAPIWHVLAGVAAILVESLKTLNSDPVRRSAAGDGQTAISPGPCPP